MRSILLYLFAFFLLLLEHKQVMAQADFVDDAAVWVNFYLEKKINKQWEIHLNQQNRIDENVSQYRMGYTDWGVTYRFNKKWKILGDYVFSQRKILDGTFSSRHQIYTALVYKHSYRRWDFMYRNMLQAGFRDIYSSEDGAVAEYYERNKGTIKYHPTKRITLYTAQELYYPFNQRKNKGFDRLRTFGGVFYKLTKNTKIEFYYLYQHQLNAFNRTKNYHVYGFGLEHNF